MSATYRVSVMSSPECWQRPAAVTRSAEKVPFDRVPFDRARECNADDSPQRETGLRTRLLAEAGTMIRVPIPVPHPDLPQAPGRTLSACHGAISPTQGGARGANLPWAALPGTFGAKATQGGAGTARPGAALAGRAGPGLPCPAAPVRKPPGRCPRLSCPARSGLPTGCTRTAASLTAI